MAPRPFPVTQAWVDAHMAETRRLEWSAIRWSAAAVMVWSLLLWEVL